METMTQKLILLGLFVGVMILMSFNYQRKKKVIFFGDSITEMGVQQGGYVRVMEEMLRQQGLENKYELTGAGVSGNKIYDLYLRMESDVLKKSPDIVVIYIGVNDVWHKSSMGTGTDYDKFGLFYDAVVKRLQAAGSKVIVCTPAVIGEKTDGSNEQDGDLNHYSNWIRKYAANNKLALVDLRKQFLDYNLQYNKENREAKILTSDRVHLNQKGNEFVAEAMWKVIKTLP